MTSKKQKIITMADALLSADAFMRSSAQICSRTRAIEAALNAMEPPLDDVHEGILRLIAEFAKPYGKSRGGPRIETQTIPMCCVRF